MKHWQDCALPNGNLFPKQYSLLEVLRESGTSSILLGFDQKEDRKVVIKCFKQGGKGAYLREISAVYDLKHDNLARCLNTFHRTDGQSCLVYEYLAGGNLAGLLEARAVLDVGLILKCLHDVLNALIYLHAHNLIHCDIKPENIFLRPTTDTRFEFVLGDLGAACFIREAREGQHVIGTPAYIAPERIRNQFFFNSDLYSLGVVAYELATGVRPFMGTVEEITQANLSQIPALDGIKYQPLIELIDCLLTKSPQKRIESASRSYFYLNKFQKQYDEKWGGIQSSPKGAACLPELSRFNVPVENNLQGLQCFYVSDRILIGLSYSGYTDIIDPNAPDVALITVLNRGSLQLVGNGTFIYATPTRIQCLNLGNLQSSTVMEKINGPKDFDFHHNCLLFTDDFNVQYHNLDTGDNFSFRSPSYLLGSKMSVFENGTFCMSEGVANEKLVGRDHTGAVTFQWVLDGPLVAMARVGSSTLGVTLSVKDQNTYSIWYLNESEEARKCVLTHKIKQINCVENTIYWLTQDAEIYCCGVDLKPRKIGVFSNNAVYFAVSFDGKKIVVLDLIERNQALVTIFNNRGL